jgi:acyl carrier protein
MSESTQTDGRIETINRMLTEVMKKKKVLLPEHNLVEDLGLNSLQLMDLIAKIETEYDVIVPIQKVSAMKTVRDLQNAVANLEEFCR